MIDSSLFIETPRCIEFMGDSLIVGCKIAFYIQDVDSFSITKTIMTKCSKSSICYLSVASSTNPEMMLLDSDNTIRTFDKQGISTHSVSIYFGFDCRRKN